MDFHKDAFECRPNQVDFTLNLSIVDQYGNCVQVLPLSCQGLCFPYDINRAVQEIVQQVNGRIQSADRQGPRALAPSV